MTSNKPSNKRELETQIQPMATILLPSRDINVETPNSRRLQWVGMTPLEWIESLATKTEMQESRRFHRPVTPIRIGDQCLANQNGISSDNNHNSNSLQAHSAVMDSVMGPKTRTAPRPDAVASSNHQAFPPSQHNLHRSHSYHLHEQHPQNQVPNHWDLSCFQAVGTLFLHRIRNLAIAVESQPNFAKHLQLSYERTRDHCLWSIARGSNSGIVDMEKLCLGAIHKLQALLDLSQKLAVQEKALLEDHGRLATCQDNRTLPSEVEGATNGGPPPSPLPTPPSTPNRKQDLSKYMTKWLRENWTNPYPDEIALQQMSQECGSTSTVVSNWLINARTRKWRPSIIRAYDMERPADLLLEDSVRIFSGQPVRQLDPSLMLSNPTGSGAIGNKTSNVHSPPPREIASTPNKRARKM